MESRATAIARVTAPVRRFGWWFGLGMAVLCWPATSRADAPQPGAPVSGLVAQLTVEPATAAATEPIEVRVTFRNAGSTPLAVCAGFDGGGAWYSYKLQTADGERVPLADPAYEGRVSLPADFRQLAPGASAEVLRAPLSDRWSSIQPGTYRLQVEFWVHADEAYEGLDHHHVEGAWRGLVISNPVTFTITGAPSTTTP